jgi:hypothetical protein
MGKRTSAAGTPIKTVFEPRSGNWHRDTVTAALDLYSEWKSVFADFSDTLQRAQIDA